MWVRNKYTDLSSGIAIQTSVKSMKEALKSNKVSIYKVKYIKSFEDEEEDIEVHFYTFSESYIGVRQACKMSAYKYKKELC